MVIGAFGTVSAVKGIVFGIAAALLLVAPAAAATITEPSDSHFPYQRWADEARVPTPELTVEVFEAPYDVCGGGATACTAEHRVWFDSRYFGTESTRGVFAHELGHIFDEERSTIASRHLFRHLTDSRLPWFEADLMAPGEQFAQHYRWCMLGRPQRVGVVCELIRSM